PNGKIDWNNLRYIPEDFYDSLKKGKVKRGDILVVKDGATTGKTCYVDDLPFPKVAVNEHVFILRVKNPNILLDEFLFYILFSDIGQTQILKFFHGSTQGGINQKDIKNITIPIPPLEIQEQMVVYIKETFKKIDSLKELRKKTKNKLDQIFYSAVEEKFNHIKEKWEGWKLKEVCIINPDKNEIKNMPDNLEVSFIPMEAIDEVTGSIITQKKKRLREVKKGYTYFKEGDVLFARITPCMENGKVAIATNLINNIGFGSTEFHVLRPSDNILSKWIYFYVKQPWFRKEAERHFVGTVGHQRVPQKFLEDFEIPVPPLEIQIKLVDYFDDLQKKIEILKQLQEEQLRKIEEFKKSFLNFLFSQICCKDK
ncbi:MAG: restriction endonuclease subunit S, partial [candidate division WOR-3 bacterium]